MYRFTKSNPKKLILFASTVATLLFVRYNHSKLIYFPKMQFGKSPKNNPYPYRNPQQYGLQYDNVQINSKDETILRGWYIKCLQQKYPQRIILYFHQNAGNIGTRLPYIKKIIQKTASNIVIIAYRGYSDSQGIPSQSGIKKDSQAILQWTINKAKQQKLPVIVLGRSLGGASTIYACSKFQQGIKGIILQNTFTSVKNVVLDTCHSLLKPFINVILFLVLSTKWSSIDIIKDIKVPILFIKSQKDKLIPISQMNQLQQKCQTQHYEYRIKNGTHNQTWTLECQKYFKKFNQFFSKL